jgi:hypothetical protein
LNPLPASASNSASPGVNVAILTSKPSETAPHQFRPSHKTKGPQELVACGPCIVRSCLNDYKTGAQATAATRQRQFAQAFPLMQSIIAAQITQQHGELSMVFPSRICD